MKSDLDTLAALMKLDVANADDAAVHDVLARTDDSPIDADAVTRVAAWIRAHPRESMFLHASLATGNPQLFERLATRLVSAHPDLVVFAYAGAISVDSERAARILKNIASDERAGVREHLFALFGRHQRLVPPGSIELPFQRELFVALARQAISDPASVVRQRAIAAAYGVGVAPLLEDEILARITDESMAVRQYALVALGVATSAKSRDALIDRLDHGSQEEVTSAIWALARRPDGVERVLELASDSRVWVVKELLGAIAEVSAPLTDAQLAAAMDARRDVEHLREMHIARTRGGAAERGPDGRITLVVRGDKP